MLLLQTKLFTPKHADIYLLRLLSFTLTFRVRSSTDLKRLKTLPYVVPGL